MKSTTITLEEHILSEARRYAKEQGYSFNAWVNTLINEAISQPQDKTIGTLLSLADEIAGNSKGALWTKEELYER